jgi:hypothetical protein
VPSSHCRRGKDHPQAAELFNPDNLPALHEQRSKTELSLQSPDCRVWRSTRLLDNP